MGKALQKRMQQAKFDSAVTEAMFNILITADFLRGIADDACAGYGLTSGQYNVLRILRGAGPEGRSRCEIAVRLLERAPDVTRLVDRLAAQELVERDRSEQDRRLSISRITQKGLDLIAEMEPAMKGAQSQWSERLSKRDAKELSRICEGIYGEED